MSADQRTGEADGVVVSGEGAEVALFFDWENFKKGVKQKLERAPDLSIIKKVAWRHGRLVLARAYANWQDGQFPKDCELLFNQGIDPVFVPTGTKNSADVRLAGECVEQVLSRPNLRTVVLVTGDRDFIPVITLLRSHGRKIVVVSVSGTFVPALTYLPDAFLLYERLAIGYLQLRGDRGEQMEAALQVLGDGVRQMAAAGSTPDAPLAKAILLERLPGFNEEEFGFPRFEYLLYAAEHRGLVRVDATQWPQMVLAPANPNVPNSDTVFERADWMWLITYMQGMGGPRFESSVVDDVRKADIPASKNAARFVKVARSSGVLSFLDEQRYNATERVYKPFRGLHLNEQNPRVQVYLGLGKLDAEA